MLDSLVRVSRRVLKVPKAVASLTGKCKEPVRGHRRLTAGQAPDNGTRSVNPSEAYLPTSLNALGAAQYRSNSDLYRRAVGRATAGLPRTRANAARQATLRAVDRHPTGRDVLLGEKCTPTAPDMTQQPRARRRDDEHRE